MIRALAVDTSTWWCGVALVEREGAASDVRVVGEVGLWVRHSHADGLLHWIERLLEGAGWSKTAIDAYVAVRGPGSFTGVRVALGTVRGLGAATDRPCVGVTTLEALAEAHGPAAVPRIAVMDAGRNEVYTAAYDAESAPPRELGAPRLCAASLGPLVGKLGPALVIPGPGTDLADPGGTEVVGVARHPRGIAAAAGRIALLRGLDAEPRADALSPLYVRPPDAVKKRGQR